MDASAQQNQAAPKPFPLSSTAKQLTRYLFGDIQFPAFLQQNGPVMLIFAGGALTASGIHQLIQGYRENRQKVQLAVFHVLRMIEHHPTAERWADDPRALIVQMEKEVKKLVRDHLTPNEAASAMKELKRKVWVAVNEDIEEEREKKRRMKARGKKTLQPVEKSSGDKTRKRKSLHPEEGAQEGRKRIKTKMQLGEDKDKLAQAQHQEEVHRRIFGRALPPPITDEAVQAELLQLEEEFNAGLSDVDDQDGAQPSSPLERHAQRRSRAHKVVLHSSKDRSPRTNPDKQLSSSHVSSTDESSSASEGSGDSTLPTQARQRPQNPSPRAARNGHDSDDDEEDDDEEDDDDDDEDNDDRFSSPPEQASFVMEKHMTMVDVATLRASGKLSYTTPAFPPPLATRPISTVSTSLPPVTLNAKSRGRKHGTQLSPIDEGQSPYTSPPRIAASSAAQKSASPKPSRTLSSPSPLRAESTPKSKTPSPLKSGKAGARTPKTPRRTQTPGVRKSARKSAFKGMYGK